MTPEQRAVLPQYLLPKQILTTLAGKVAHLRGGAFTQALITRFVARYQVNMAEAADPRVDSYASFNDFFTRPLRAGARPLAQADFVCPVDGVVSQLGAIAGDQIFQAKGHHYSTRVLLGGDATLAAQFHGGNFATIYLAPKDYHRIHMPCAATLLRMIHVPGGLFSVNPTTARGVPALFARNERVVCVFDTAYGPFIQVLVGATIVGSMATTWHGQVNPPRTGQLRQWSYDGQGIHLKQGDEMGRFLLGSTVVLLWPKGVVRLNPGWHEALPVRLGQAMGSLA